MRKDGAAALVGPLKAALCGQSMPMRVGPCGLEGNEALTEPWSPAGRAPARVHGGALPVTAVPRPPRPQQYTPQQLVKGMYSEFVPGWLDTWPRDRMIFMRTEVSALGC
jgi:hypothetical protein